MFRGENRQVMLSNLYMKIRKVLIYVILIVLATICVFTIYSLTINSTRDTNNIRLKFTLIWGRTGGRNFAYALGLKSGKWNIASLLAVSVMRGLLNSLVIASLSTLLTVYFSCVTAYGIHMYQFKLRNAAFTFILVIMMIPSQVSSAGFLNLCYDYGWINRYFPLIIPGIAAPVTFFYIKQYMESVLPYEMVEAARVDGAGEIRIFHQIVLPVLKPAIAVQVIFSFVGSWNNYFMPNLIIQDPEMKTMPIIISSLYGATDGTPDYGVINAVIFLGVVPLIVVYFIFSRYIIKGLTLGAVKG